MQETLVSNELSIRDLSSRWPGPSFWSPALGRQGGVAILIKDTFNGHVLNWRKDSSGHIISLLLDLSEIRINLINIYAPVNPSERSVFFDNLHEFFIPADATIVGGDFNCYDCELDKFGGNASIAKCLSDFKSTFKFVDVCGNYMVDPTR